MVHYSMMTSFFVTIQKKKRKKEKKNGSDGNSERIWRRKWLWRMASRSSRSKRLRSRSNRGKWLWNSNRSRRIWNSRRSKWVWRHGSSRWLCLRNVLLSLHRKRLSNASRAASLRPHTVPQLRHHLADPSISSQPALLLLLLFIPLHLFLCNHTTSPTSRLLTLCGDQQMSHSLVSTTTASRQASDQLSTSSTPRHDGPATISSRLLPPVPPDHRMAAQIRR